MENERYFKRELDLGSCVLNICQEFKSDVGGVVWDSAIVTCHYIARNAKFWKGKKVLELGAGTGICSIALAAMGATVVSTDLEERLFLIEKNASINEEAIKLNGGNVIVKALNWSKPPESYETDIVLLVDAFYYIQGVEDLLKTLLRLKCMYILCAYEIRDIGEPEVAQKRFFELASAHFLIEDIPSSELDPVYSHPDIRIFRLLNIK